MCTIKLISWSYQLCSYVLGKQEWSIWDKNIFCQRILLHLFLFSILGTWILFNFPSRRCSANLVFQWIEKCSPDFPHALNFWKGFGDNPCIWKYVIVDYPWKMYTVDIMIILQYLFGDWDTVKNQEARWSLLIFEEEKYEIKAYWHELICPYD